MLGELAREFSHPLPDLLAWYAEDLEGFSAMTRMQARKIVAEHIGRGPEARESAN